MGCKILKCRPCKITIDRLRFLVYLARALPQLLGRLALPVQESLDDTQYEKALDWLCAHDAQASAADVLTELRIARADSIVKVVDVSARQCREI